MASRAPLVPEPGAFCSLEARSLRYTAGRRGPEILRGVSTGPLPRGCLCAVMGASGSGKTTLLKVLGGKLRPQAGAVLVDGEARTDLRHWKRIAALIPQEDVLPRSLSPQQVFRFQAHLQGLTGEAAEAAVEAVLEKLQLTKCRHTQIGDGHTLQGLSGGERKRCSVGIELLRRPQVLLLDEPTSGLDGPLALELLSTLRSLCQGDAEQGLGILAVCTIHQPSSKAFALVDRLLLLREGEVAYAGPSADAASYFEGLDPRNEVPPLTNPAEHLLELLQGPCPPPAMLESSILGESCEAHGGSSLQARAAAASYATSWAQQTWLLFRRTLLMRTRDPAQFRVRILLSAMVACVLGLTYFQVADTQGTLTDRQAVMFGCLVFLTMNTMMSTAIQFPLEKAFIFREYHNGSYRLMAWYVANLMASLMLQLLFSLVYVVLLYTMVGLRLGIGHFALYLSVCVMMGSIGVVVGTIVGVALPAVHMVTAVVPPLIMPQLIFSGFMIRPGNIPVYFKPFYYISFFQYSFRILMTDQLTGFSFALCDPFSGDFCPLGPGVQDGDLWITVMLGYDKGHDALLVCWVALASMLAALLLLGYWVTKWKAATG